RARQARTGSGGTEEIEMSIRPSLVQQSRGRRSTPPNIPGFGQRWGVSPPARRPSANVDAARGAESTRARKKGQAEPKSSRSRAGELLRSRARIVCREAERALYLSLLVHHVTAGRWSGPEAAARSR